MAVSLPLPFPRQTIAFDELQKEMSGLSATFRQRGKLPPQMRKITDWALYEAIETKTFSSPWEKGLLQAEKARRDRIRNAVRPAIWGGVSGALVTGMIQLGQWLAS
jgi:hypothetical protein